LEGRESLPWGGSLLSLDFYFARILAAAMQMCSAALLSMLHLCLGCCARLRCLLILQVQATGGRLRASLMRHVYALQDALMNYVLRNCILYNVAWEDPRIDGDLLQLQNDDNVLVLTTGGCNVLDRLIDEPLHIVAVDLNAAQNALLELKLAGLRVLCHEDFFQLFALSNRDLFDARYTAALRPLLSQEAAAFWDVNASFFDNVMYAGAAGKLARVLKLVAHLFGLGPFIASLEACPSLEEQRRRLATVKGRCGLFTRMCKLCMPVICAFAGVPASQMTLIEEEEIFSTILGRVFHDTHIAGDNYFYFGYLYGYYSRANCPRYLRPEHFETLKASATRVTVVRGMLHEVAARYPDGYFTAMVLLDHMDWLSREQVITHGTIPHRTAPHRTARHAARYAPNTNPSAHPPARFSRYTSSSR